MLIFITTGVLSLVALYFGSSAFIQGSAQGALYLHLPKRLVGLVLVSFATSAPELFTSVGAALQGRMDTAAGNVVGSNIANLTLVLGTLLLFKPVCIRLADEKPAGLFMLAACFLMPVATWNNYIDWWEGGLLFAGLLLFFLHTYRHAGQIDRQPPTALSSEEQVQEKVLEHVVVAHLSPAATAAAFFGGLVLLLTATQGLLWSATHIAQHYGINDLIIGLTIVAIGTSLPELAASLMSVWKKEDDIAVGNIIGSNIFNIFGVAGVTALVAPGSVSGMLTYRDAPVMIFLCLLAMALIAMRRGKPVGRTEGGILLACFICYQYMLYLSVFPYGS